MGCSAGDFDKEPGLGGAGEDAAGFEDEGAVGEGDEAGALAGEEATLALAVEGEDAGAAPFDRLAERHSAVGADGDGNDEPGGERNADGAAWLAEVDGEGGALGDGQAKHPADGGEAGDGGVGAEEEDGRELGGLPDGAGAGEAVGDEGGIDEGEVGRFALDLDVDARAPAGGIVERNAAGGDEPGGEAGDGGLAGDGEDVVRARREGKDGQPGPGCGRGPAGTVASASRGRLRPSRASSTRRCGPGR
jgi:hypothetical protein